MDAFHNEELILGLDLGSASVGWSLVGIHRQNKRIVAAGVRRFEAGTSGEIDRGRDTSNAVARRTKRGARRQTWRRKHRLAKVFRCLQHHGMLPPTEDDSLGERTKLLSELDASVAANDLAASHVDQQRPLYRLRAKAIHEKLDLSLVGRAIYHLAQRRGFLSNRKTDTTEEEKSQVKQKIGELANAIEEKGARTLGEYLSNIDPTEERIRARWTSRDMFITEFTEIWANQKKFHSELTESAKNDLFRALFFQRPLKSQAGLIGRCELEPRRRRAPIACLHAQQIRLVQMINDLELTSPEGEVRRLVSDEREKLASELDRFGDLSWTRILKVLGLKNQRGAQHKWEFNFTASRKSGMIGNRTAAKIRSVIDDEWDQWPEDKQVALVDDLLRFESEEKLVVFLQTHWRLPRETAKRLASIELEQGYHSLSRRAIRRILPRMVDGEQFATSRKQIYGDSLLPTTEAQLLPSVGKAMPSLRNPAVARALSELRKVVNALIRCYGKPCMIRVELGRDLKHSRDRRRRMADRMHENMKARESIGMRLLKAGFRDSSTNILKVRLAEECGWICPYTGKSIGMGELVGEQPQFDIEHIIPLSRSLDNSYANKTLCYHAENRHRKGNRTPFEAYGGTDAYGDILTRVKLFNGSWIAVAAKLEKFKHAERDSEEDFTSRQLNDTRYMSRLAADYLGLLYGGRTDASGRQRVQTPTGGVTGYLRKYWGLNEIIGLADVKNRADHRHHAIDATVVALTDPSAVHQLARAAELAETNGQGLFAPIAPPWANFMDDVRSVIEGITVSSRVNLRLNGSLHNDTVYSKPVLIRKDNGDESVVHHERVSLHRLKGPDIEKIVDPVVRKVVREQLNRLGGKPDTAFADPNQHPYLVSKDGRIIPIHKVRIRRSVKPMAIGRGAGRRYVKPDNNHHMEIIASLDANGNEVAWEGLVVSRYEANQRRRLKQSVIQRDHGSSKRFKFSIRGTEHLVLQISEDGRGPCEVLFRVLSISAKEIECVLHTDARPSKVLRVGGGRMRPSPARLKSLGARKVTVSPLGEILPAND